MSQRTQTMNRRIFLQASAVGAAGAACACGAVAGAGEDGASCWALTLEIGRKRATSIAALARRADGRIKRISFNDGKLPRLLAYT